MKIGTWSATHAMPCLLGSRHAVLYSQRKCIHGMTKPSYMRMAQYYSDSGVLVARPLRGLCFQRQERPIPQATVCGSVDSQQPQEDDGSNELALKQPKGYRVFHMDGCSFLVKEIDRESSILDLNDVYVVDNVTEETRRPTTNPDTMPASIPPAMYHDVEWASFFPGNEFEDKEPITWVLKVYLIAIKSNEPYELDFDTVFVLNAADGSIAKSRVKRLAPPDTPEHMLQIRIRESGITIDRTDSLPDPETVVRSKLEGVPAMSLLEEALEDGSGSSDTKEHDGTRATKAEREHVEDEEDQDDAFDDDDDDSLSDFLTEVDDDSDSEFDDDVDLDDDAFDDDGAGEDFD